MKTWSFIGAAARLLAAASGCVLTEVANAEPPKDQNPMVQPLDVESPVSPVVEAPPSEDGLRGVPTGVCCLFGSCRVMTAEACSAANGTYRGDNTVCAQFDCNCMTCPAGAIIEDESEDLGVFIPGDAPLTQDSDYWLNDGCNAVNTLAPNFSAQVLHCGQTICGTGMNDRTRSPSLGNAAANRRNSDWYPLVLTEPKVVTFTLTSEIPSFQLDIIRDPGGGNDPVNDPAGWCSTTTGFGGLVQQNTGNCTSSTGSLCLGPGTHVVYVAFIADPVGQGTGTGAPFQDTDGDTGPKLGGPHRYTLAIECSDPPPADPENECENAIAVSEPSFVFDVKTCSQSSLDTQEPTFSPCNANANDNNSEWYKFTASQTSYYAIGACNATAFDMVLSIWQGSCGNFTLVPGGCGDDTCNIAGGPSVVYVILTQGQEYYIRIAGWNNVGGTGTMSMQPLPTGNVATLPDYQPPDQVDGVQSDYALFKAADGFSTAGGDVRGGASVTEINWWGVYEDVAPLASDFFLVTFYPDDGSGVPDNSQPTTFAQGVDLTVERAFTGNLVAGVFAEAEYRATISGGYQVQPGRCYWIEIANLPDNGLAWYVETGSDGDGAVYQDGDGAASPDGYTLNERATDCIDLAFAVNTSTSPSTCFTPQSGACCHADGSCTVTIECDCTGTYQGDGTTCGAANCPQPTGACCLASGECVEVEEADCNGAYQGDGTTCAATNCPLPDGACCIGRCDCQILSPEDCAAAGGSFNGAGSVCEDITQCFPNPACPCDVNGFDGLDSQDFFDFLDLFFATDPAADINCADGVDSQDYFDFIECFFGGACGG